MSDGILSIVRGNDILLKIPVEKAFVTDGEITTESVVLSSLDSLFVYLCKGLDRFPISYEIDGSTIILPIGGDKLGLGTYSIEILGSKSGENLRSKQLSQFRIVDNNGETNLPSNVEFSYTVYNLTGVCITACGDSAYDIAVKNGFVGTQEEWLDSLKASVTKSSVEKVLIGDITSHNHNTQVNDKLSLYATITTLNENIERLQGQLDILNNNKYFLIK